MTVKNWFRQRRYEKHLHALQGVTRWRRTLIVVACVVVDVVPSVMALEHADQRDGPNWSDATLTYVAIAWLANIATWILVPFALRHVPREYSPYENYAGPRSSLVCAVAICLLAGFRQLSLSVFVAYVSLVSRGSLRWSLAGIVAMTVSFGYKAYSPDTLYSIPVTIFGYLLLWCVFVLSGFVIGMVRHSRRRKQSALVAQAELNRETMKANAEKVRQEERDRLARDMHDSLSHRLSMISVFAGGLAFREDLSREQIAESASTIQSEAELAVKDLRQVIRSLRLEDRIDPRSSIEDHVVRARAAGTRVKIRYTDDCTDELSTMGVHALSRAVQEGLTNARKYAPGQKVTIEVAREDNMARVTMSNRKAGKAPSSCGGNGLLGMRERAQLVGGRLEVHDDEDFSWSLYLPLEER